MTLEELKNEVLRKIGRNVMLFQQMEHMLKDLSANASISGYASELEIKKEQRAATIHKQTMGRVVGQFVENFFTVVEEIENEPEELKELWINYSFKIGGYSEEFYEKRKTALASIVTERNNLIHHLLPKWDMNSYETTIKIEHYLDEQQKRILPELNFLNTLIKTIQEAVKMLSSDGIQKLFLWINLIERLVDIENQQARRDGWVVLDSAAQVIRQHVPEILINLKERYGYKTIKEFILATECFDVTEEATNKGGIRFLYRSKPDLDSIVIESI